MSLLGLVLGLRWGWGMATYDPARRYAIEDTLNVIRNASSHAVGHLLSVHRTFWPAHTELYPTLGVTPPLLLALNTCCGACKH
ncbi:hypothetical protein AQUCO_11500014v1 [Aquilegia coerulea]|uniref:Uncharacterized protein n=1 Tax=Aquilegia coerulea TaxID=218851 RepID=A0A2G5C3L5_AQUCA|nr:hypothetical protein AQUCO_11500014v1 [Aquilegia coerulea]